MAGAFLRSHGIDIDAEMARIQFGDAHQSPSEPSRTVIHNVSLPGRDPGRKWDVHISHGHVERIAGSEEMAGRHDRLVVDGHGALLAPSLCHPHIHLDKAYLLAHPKYADLQIEQGDFPEAMKLTGKAKSLFDHQDLLERGQRVIDESVAAGVTHMRAFVEVDAGVQTKCLTAGLALKRRTAEEKQCVVQLCAFAQLPLFSPSQDDPAGAVIRDLMRQAAREDGIEAIGSTPYVEAERHAMERNVECMIDISMEFNLHLDFHLDYNLDPQTEPLVWFVVETLIRKNWVNHTDQRTVVLGHCTRLVLFDESTWERLAATIAEAKLPISFVGLPTSDLFMMRTGRQPEVRGTLHVPRLIKSHSLNACIGVNNIGNAFTPHGSCDPLALACQGVGIYQAGTKRDAELLFEAVSTRAKAAIGYGQSHSRALHLNVEVADEASLVLFGREKEGWRTRASVSDAIYMYDHGRNRRTWLKGDSIAATYT